MRIVFISNFFNPHQRFLSDALYQIDGVEYRFIAFSPMPEERIKMGYAMGDIPPYVCIAYENEKSLLFSQKLLAEADVVIAGSAPGKIVKDCLRNNKLLLRYSERPLKNGNQPLKYIPRFICWHHRNPFYKRIYMLCASAYTAGDYRKFGLFFRRTYKWGYFPETKKYSDINALMAGKDKHQILWCGRFLALKHADDAILTAKRLRDEGYSFVLNMIGGGDQEEKLKELTAFYGLENVIKFHGIMNTEQVRQAMENVGIYMFTSDRMEGWGAVLNESMNSGCAVVASDAVGSVPYLLQHKSNGLIYQSGNVNQLYENVKYLLDYPEEQERLGRKAYTTIVDTWNAENAAKRLVELLQHLMSGEKYPKIFHDGPCSPSL